MLDRTSSTAAKNLPRWGQKQRTLTEFDTTCNQLSEPLRGIVQALLTPGESLRAVFQPDLDGRLKYSDGLVVLTDRRLLARESPDAKLVAWPLAQVERLLARDRGGLGTLEALGTNTRLHCWYHTVSRAGAARDLADAFQRLATGQGPGGANAREEVLVPEGEKPATPANVRSIFRLFRFARAHIAALVLGLLLTLGSTAAGLVPPYLTWPLVDKVLEPYQDHVKQVRATPGMSDREHAARMRSLEQEGQVGLHRVGFYLLAFAAASLLAWAFGWAQGWVLARVSERISADLRDTTYAHLQKLSLEFFGTKRTGDLVARISSDTDRICSFLSDTLVDFIADVLMIMGTAVVLISIDPILAAATLCTFPIIAWLTVHLRDRLTHGFLHGSRAWAEMTSILADTVPGIRVVKAFAQEKREVERFKASNRRIIAANDRVNKLWTFFWPAVALLTQIGLLVVWAIGAWEVFSGRITVGVLVAFLAYIGRFYARLESMSRMLSSTQRAAASSQRLFEILDRPPGVPEPVHPTDPGKVRGGIELRDVSFRFGSRQVIDGVSVEVKPGEMIGLVGTTGAGKSTLVNLVCRFYDVSEGAVLVDGTDIRSFPISEYRRHIGIVLQDPFLFWGTIAENIAYGKPEAARAEIVAAARAARAHEFILQLSDGYDSMVGERGHTLSGGERQRISIARALLIDPSILILDEATSSVDTQTEREIQEALDNLVRGRTTIAIAHRLSTLHKADRLVVLEHGRIVEMGQHADLLSAGGRYAQLYQAQMLLGQARGSFEAPRELPPPRPDRSGGVV
jgi:ATP-binding cassette subfamily B protein